MDDDYDAYLKQAYEHEATFSKSDRVARMEKQARNDAAYEANRAELLRQNPWPTDPTALRGHRMGLQEFIRERGD